MNKNWPTYYATYYVGNGQYTPSRKRRDGKGYQSIPIRAADISAAAVIAKANYLKSKTSKMFDQPPTAILLIQLKDGPREAGCFHFNDLSRYT